MSNFAQISFDLVADIKKCTCPNEVHAIMMRGADIFSYDTFVIAEAPAKSMDALHDRLILAQWPAQWSARYARSGYIHHDPVVAHTRRTAEPFLWSKAPVRRDERLARIIMGEAAEIGLRDGFCIPVQDFQSTRMVSFGGTHIDLPEHAAAGLHLLGLYADLTVRSLTADTQKRRERHLITPLCSPREIECIKWTAAGKTSWETSEILSLSSRTVDDYLKTAARKLGAANRPHLVAKAMRSGLID
ncbi:autoinducer binding domain-containing protein [Methylobacterium indicum]|uniref:Transcriptional activator protein BjaR1 n=1 Tax=Methylobacterium indicum TaxID=1775910 RepID=A0A8H8X0P8_9HYPH|nr:autoinducer binding domain-containing protein [Methylobacterium indicum]BCM87914.1 transcriptional activator protein BjaR1 [Methylobacterium indicum]